MVLSYRLYILKKTNLSSFVFFNLPKVMFTVLDKRYEDKIIQTVKWLVNCYKKHIDRWKQKNCALWTKQGSWL